MFPELYLSFNSEADHPDTGSDWTRIATFAQVDEPPTPNAENAAPKTITYLYNKATREIGFKILSSLNGIAFHFATVGTSHVLYWTYQGITRRFNGLTGLPNLDGGYIGAPGIN